MPAAPSVGVLVGPGVLGALAGLHRLAERLGVAVVNTWGAKGVFRWDSPFHGGTAGLQERDFELAGLGEVDVLITSGLDPAEVTTTPWAGRAEVVDVEPPALAAFAGSWAHPPADPVRPRLYTELAAVIQPLYGDPGSPAARVHELSRRLPPDGVVCAPPGLAGFWIARTWSTTVPGSVVVPGSCDEGVALRRAGEAARAGRPVLYVTDTAVQGEPGIDGVEVVVWAGDLTIPDALLAVAGPVVAWSRLRAVDANLQ